MNLLKCTYQPQIHWVLTFYGSSRSSISTNVRSVHIFQILENILCFISAKNLDAEKILKIAIHFK